MKRFYVETILSFAFSLIASIEVVERVFKETETVRFFFGTLIIFFFIFSWLMVLFLAFEEHEEREKIRKIKMLKNRDLRAYEKERSKLYENLEN